MTEGGGVSVSSLYNSRRLVLLRNTVGIPSNFYHGAQNTLDCLRKILISASCMLYLSISVPGFSSISLNASLSTTMSSTFSGQSYFESLVNILVLLRLMKMIPMILLYVMTMLTELFCELVATFSILHGSY